MSFHTKIAGDTAKQKKKSKGVWGRPYYTIKTQRQLLNTEDALSAVISQLKEKSSEKFLSENDPGDNNLPTPPHCNGEGNKSADSQCIDEAVSHSSTESGEKNLRDSVTKRSSQMGLLDTDSASDGSLNQLWDNIGNITSWSYVEHAGDDQGVTFLTPNNEKNYS